MSWVDVAALVIALLAVTDGAVSGLAWACLETVLILGAALVARLLAGPAEAYVAKVAHVPPGELPWIAHAAAYALAAISFYGLILVVHPSLKKGKWAKDRRFGLTLGILNGTAAALLVASIVIASAPQSYEEECRGSFFARAAADAWDMGIGKPFLPEHLPARAAQLWGK